MLRVVGLTLLCLAAIAVPAGASERGLAMDGRGVSAHPGATKAATRGAPAPVVGWLPTAQPALRAGSVGGLRRAMVNQPGGSAFLLHQRRKREESVAFPWLKHGRSGVAVSLTERLLVGFGYRHLEGEDLWPEFADTGAADYDSHHVLIRARWRF